MAVMWNGTRSQTATHQHNGVSVAKIYLLLSRFNDLTPGDVIAPLAHAQV